MTAQNQLSDDILHNHIRYREFLVDHVATPELAEIILRLAWALGKEEHNALRDDMKIAAWVNGLVRAAMEGTPYKKEGVDRGLKMTTNEVISKLLPILKGDNADLIQRAEIDERSLKDIAHQDRTSPEDIKSRLHRAREALKKKVLQSLGACLAHRSMDCACHRTAA